VHLADESTLSSVLRETVRSRVRQPGLSITAIILSGILAALLGTRDSNFTQAFNQSRVGLNYKICPKSARREQKFSCIFTR